MGAGCCGGGGHDGPVAKPSFNEEQESVAKWIRWYVKTKNAPVKGGEKVDWFTGQGKNSHMRHLTCHDMLGTLVQFSKSSKVVII